MSAEDPSRLRSDSSQPYNDHASDGQQHEEAEEKREHTIDDIGSKRLFEDPEKGDQEDQEDQEWPGGPTRPDTDDIPTDHERPDNNQYFVDFDGPDDPENPYNWSTWKKWTSGGLLSAMTLVTYVLSPRLCLPGAVPDLLYRTKIKLSSDELV